jgi:hypothetical protein
MATSTQLREWWKTYRCSPDKMVRVAFPGPDRMWNLLVAAEAAQAFEVFAEVMATTGYLFRESAGGTYNCRKIAGTDQWSLHSYGIAIDLNPSKNPYGKPLRHDFPQEFLDGVDSIITSTGQRAFKWGGRWNTPDAMHFEIDVPPAALADGVTWSGQQPQEEGMLPLKLGDGTGDRAHKIEDVRYLQERLNQAGANLELDGIYGPATAAAVAKYTMPTGNPAGQRGEWFGGRQAANLDRLLSGGGLTPAQVKAIISDTQVVAHLEP